MKHIYYLPDTFSAYYIAEIFRNSEKSILIITPDEKHGLFLRNNIHTFLAKAQIHLLKTPEFFDDAITSESVANRVIFFENLLKTEKRIFISSIASLQYPPPIYQSLLNKSISINKGESIDYDELKGLLNKLGYKRVGIVDTPGTVSIRGDILDIFPFDKATAYRIFLDDETVSNITKLNLTNLSDNVDIDYFKFSVFQQNDAQGGNISDYFTHFTGICFFDNIEQLQYFGGQRVIKLLAKSGGGIARHTAEFKAAEKINVHAIPFFNDSLKSFTSFLAFHSEIRDVIIFSRDIHYKKRLLSIIHQRFSLTGNRIEIKIGNLTNGFIYEDRALVVLSEDTIYNRIYKPEIIHPKTTEKLFNISSLKSGDYVVHINYGIGKFLGLTRMEITGRMMELIKIEYADKSFLYLPHYQLDFITKYSFIGSVIPKLSTLGTPTWQRLRARAHKAIKDFTAKLLIMESNRKLSAPLILNSDELLQEQFDAAFEYSETPDQLKAIHKIKKSLDEGELLDWIICGDSGVGKTEVAFRAISRVVFSGYQSIFVAPSVLLASQHYENLIHRFAEFPVRIALLTRLQTAGEFNGVLKDIAAGKIDIIVGTHKVFSSKITFRDPGLLVIDEEHRFGVLQKEHFKQLFKNINIIYLTATPIPRTLYQALSGLRRMSIIENIPTGRKPISILVSDFDESIVRKAIERELHRGGQVFYVHNRIRFLPAIVKLLKSFFPTVSIAFIHSRLSREKIIDTMHKFSDREIDILVSTNIIELGIDLPNANTIIIHGIERLGFAQIYQLRGRVGRGFRQAYAILLFNRPAKIPVHIREKYLDFARFSQSGGGLRIALKDMEIRGAGNLLGTEQKGHINNIGFELYNELLNAAIAQLKGEPAIKLDEVDINTGLSSYIPDDYVSDLKEKMMLYLKIARCKKTDELDAVYTEFERIYAHLSEPIQNLFLITRLKILARKYGFSKIVYKSDVLLIESTNPAALKHINLKNAKVKLKSTRILVEIYNTVKSPFSIYKVLKD